MGVTIKNLDRLQAKLDKLEPVTRDALARGVSLAGTAVEGSARYRVPVDTGALRASITGKTKKTSDGAEASVGSGLEYAMYVELGTSKSKAQPFLQPALQKNKAKSRKLIMTEILKAHKGLK